MFLTLLSSPCSRVFHFRPAAGSREDCFRNLKAFGITAKYDQLFESDGTFKTLWYKEVLEKRRTLERQNLQVDHVGVPSRNDVIFGRGRGLYNHAGNIRLGKLIDNMMGKYDCVSNKDKKAITEMIVNAIKKYSGRFLKDDETGWVEVDDVVARSKVSHLFRSKRRSRTKSFEGPFAHDTDNEIRFGSLSNSPKLLARPLGRSEDESVPKRQRTAWTNF